MTDESTHSAPTSPFSAEGTEPFSGQPTVAFCQQCGRGLTVSTVRAIGSGIFCEPCATRSSAAPHASTAGSTAGGSTRVQAPILDPAAPPPPLPGQPNPALAAFLGLIPGVGAMYNGQYPKGVIHLVIFVVLTSLADNLNWVLWWFVWGWIFYQAFEAYHTAQARRDGQPLPDPFGWNDLGERLGLNRTSPPVSSPARNATRVTPDLSGAAPTPMPPPSPEPYAQKHEPPPTVAAAEPGFDSVPASASVPVPSSAAHFTSTESGSPVPPRYVPFERQYGPTYTGMSTAPSASPLTQPSLAQRFPAGAAWLIGLGILFLIANLAPEWRLQARWLVPLLLALVAFWIGGRRVEAALRNRDPEATPDLAALAEGLVGAAILLTLAILLALQNAYLVPLRHSWPAVLIVWGALLLVGRARPLSRPSGPAQSPEQQPPGTSPLR